MLTFMTVVGDPTGAVYLSDGITARHVTSTQPGVPAEQVLADLATLASEGLLRIVQPPASANTITVKGVVVRKVRSLDVIGTVVGAAAAPTTTVTAVLDPAALNAAFDAALANVAFTTRRAAL